MYSTTGMETRTIELLSKFEIKISKHNISLHCTIKINLLGFSKFLYHCFLKTVRIFTVPNLSYLFGIISEFRLGAKIGDARLWEQKYV